MNLEQDRKSKSKYTIHTNLKTSHIRHKTKFYSMEMWPMSVKPDIISYGSEFYGMEKRPPPLKQAIVAQSPNSRPGKCDPCLLNLT